MLYFLLIWSKLKSKKNKKKSIFKKYFNYVFGSADYFEKEFKNNPSLNEAMMFMIITHHFICCENFPLIKLKIRINVITRLNTHFN